MEIMKKLIITICLIGFWGCEGGNYDPTAAYMMFYQMEGRAPFTQPAYCDPIYPQWHSVSEMQRQQEIDDMLWERRYGASWPSMNPEMFAPPYPHQNPYDD
jgi:hypothetical protein